MIARSAGVDLVTGEGLEAALAGVDAVIDATNVASTGKRVSSEFFEATARTLMRTAATAGVRHIVALSIVGIDRVPYGYYQGKLRQEQVLQDSPVPVSILRAAQFHEFAGQYLAKVPGPVVIVPRWRAQPVAAREVGAALARIAVGDPVAMSELAGPREEIMADMIRQVVRARGDRRLVVSVRVPGAAGKALAAGGGLSGQAGAARDADLHRLGDRAAGAGHTVSTGTGPAGRCLQPGAAEADPGGVRDHRQPQRGRGRRRGLLVPAGLPPISDEPVRDVEAWAVVAVSRMALDVLRSARVRRERYVGPWLPEPVVASPGQTAADPADQVTLDDEVGYALLVVMETLSPAERTAFVLHDLFGVSFDEIAAIVGRTPGGRPATRLPRQAARPRAIPLASCWTRPSTGAWSRPSPQQRPQATWLR